MRTTFTNFRITVEDEMKQQNSNTGEYPFGTSIDLILLPEQKELQGLHFAFTFVSKSRVTSLQLL